jgi:hypothetical protein
VFNAPSLNSKKGGQMAAFFICDFQASLGYTGGAGLMTATIYDRAVCVTLSFYSSVRKYHNVSQPFGAVGVREYINLC